MKPSLTMLFVWIGIMVTSAAVQYYIITIGALCLVIWELLRFFNIDDINTP